MAHSIDVWRAVLLLDDERTALLLPPDSAELPADEEGLDAVVEVSRIYPALSLEIASYLAR